MTVPTPALNRAVLHTAGHSRLHHGEPLTDLWRALTSWLTEHEAQALPRSLGLVLPLLAGDQDRVRLIADLTVTVDAFEAAEPLVQFSRHYSDAMVALAAGALCSNPGVDPELETVLAESPMVQDLSGAIRRSFELRLRPDAPAENAQERLLQLQRWPGIDPGAFSEAPLAPVVAIAEEGLPYRSQWALTSALRRQGAVVRRIPAIFRKPPRAGWVGRQVPVLATSPTTLNELRRYNQDVTGAQVVVIDPEELDDTRYQQQLLESTQLLLRRVGGPTLRQQSRLDVPSTADEVLEQGVFTLGSYRVPEVAYLSGGSTHSLYRWARKLDAFAPRKVEGFSYWKFSQLVAIRFYSWLKTNVTPRIPVSVLSSLAEYAGRDRPGPVAVTSAGEVLVIEGDDDWHAIESGQQVFPDVVRIDRAFQEFQIGGGSAVVPGLLHPTPSTRVHPGVLGGTPTLQRYRISCESITRMILKHNFQAARVAYPSLTVGELEEATEVGRRILAAG